jgi:hypothetical protein
MLGLTAITHERLPRNKLGILRRKEGDEPRHIVGLAETLDRLSLWGKVEELRYSFAGAFGLNEPWGDSISKPSSAKRSA